MSRVSGCRMRGLGAEMSRLSLLQAAMLTIVLSVASASCGASAPSLLVTTPVKVVKVSTSGCSLVDDVSTGVVVADGQVLTAAHGLRGASEVQVDGMEARMVGLDSRVDAAVLAVDK